MRSSLLSTQSEPLCLKGEDRRDETENTNDSVIEVHESDRGGWEPEVKCIDDELLFGRRLGTVIKWSNAPNVNIGLGCAYASRPRNFASRSTAELTFSSAPARRKREISVVIR